VTPSESTSPHAVASAVGDLLGKVVSDPFRPPDRMVHERKCGAGTLLLSDGPADRRRSQDPMQFDNEKVECFCSLSASVRTLPFSPDSFIALIESASKALQFSRECTPEPAAAHYADAFELASSIEVPSLTVVNLRGSGASSPEHFHTQILPLRFGVGVDTRPTTYVALLANLDIGSQHLWPHEGIEVTTIEKPVWGFRVRFDKRYTPRACGLVVHQAVHRGLRYCSQLQLSYNLYLRWADEPRSAMILMRTAAMESPFATSPVLDCIERAVPGMRREISSSDNARWRWGWLECIGGVPARDSSFSQHDAFDGPFWEEVYRLVSVPPHYQPAIESQLQRGLKAAAGQVKPAP